MDSQTVRKEKWTHIADFYGQSLVYRYPWYIADSIWAESSLLISLIHTNGFVTNTAITTIHEIKPSQRLISAILDNSIGFTTNNRA